MTFPLYRRPLDPWRTKMFTSSWLRLLQKRFSEGLGRRSGIRGRASRASQPVARRSFQPRVEILEVRLVPAISLLVGADINITKSAANEAETSIALNPTNANNLFAIDTLTYQGRYSTDGGVTWPLSNMAGFTSAGANDAQAVWDSFGNLFVTRMGTGKHVQVGISTNGGGRCLVGANIADNARRTPQPTRRARP